jgi:uncharacterized protein YcbX
MSARIDRIVRHPIKAIGREEVDAITLAAGAVLPWDRVWAVAHEGAQLDGGGWVPKQNFLRGVSAPPLMAVSASLDTRAGRISLSHPLAGTLEGRPDDPDDAAALVDWLRPLWPANRPSPTRIIRADSAFTDVPDPFVSVLNSSSNRALGERVGAELSMHRWRGNFWIEGLAPWEEFDLIGRDLHLGNAVLRVEERITRCKATCANPDTGIADADTLGTLEDCYGHQDFGVYARVVAAGRVARGDEVVIA